MATVAAPAWAGYAAGSQVDDFDWWCREHAVQSIDAFAGEPLELEAWQLAFMGEALAVDEDDNPFWRSVILVVPRKNGKSSLLAAYALYHAAEDGGQPEVLLSASSDKQAGRLFNYAVSFVRRSPYLDGLFHKREYIGELARVDGEAKVNRIASKPGSAHGANPSLVVIDELHAFTTPSLKSFFAAQTTAGGARKHSQVFSITTEGEAHSRPDSILGRLVDRNESDGDVERPHGGLTISRNFDARVLVYRYSAPVKSRPKGVADPEGMAAVRLANPASWVSDEYLARQAVNPELSDAEFMQLHACVATDDADAFITGDQWGALTGVLDTAAAGGAVGIDGSYSYDTTVVAWARVAGDGRVDVSCRVFSARAEAPHHELHGDGRIDFAAVEAYTVDVVGRGGVLEVAFDPRFMGRSAELVAEQSSATVFPVEPTSRHMRDALATFHRLVLEGVVRHDGDPVVAAHVLAAVASRDDNGWRVSKRKQSRPIDAVPAMAMAVWRAAQAVHPYESRGMVTF